MTVSLVPEGALNDDDELSRVGLGEIRESEPGIKQETGGEADEKQHQRRGGSP